MTRRRRHFRPALALRRPETFDRETLLRWQARALACVVEHAGRDVPFYRRLFEAAGVDPASIRGSADLARLPVSAKPAMQRVPPSDLLAEGAEIGNLVRLGTSGSTGEPLPIFKSPAERRRLGAFRLAVLRRYGLRRRDRLAIASWVPPESRLGRGPLLRALQGLGLHRHRMIDPLQAPDVVRRELRAFRPHVVTGLTSSLLAVARLAGGPVLEGTAPRFLAPGGEMMTPWTRQQLESGFGARVFDTYGSYELQLTAWECEETGLLHVCEPSVVLELVNDSGAPVGEGERGEILGTSLHAYAMPFVRYRTGDVARRGPCPCPCGQPFATLEALEGRVADTFRLPGGRTLHPYTLLVAVMDVASTWVRQVQLLQEQTHRVRVRLLPSQEPPPGGLERIRVRLAEEVGPGVDVRPEIVDALYPARSGKFRAFRSLVDPVPDVPGPESEVEDEPLP